MHPHTSAQTSRREALTLVAGLAAGMASAGTARAQGAWPDRPIRLIVPFPAGGTVDQVARVVADELGKSLHQPLVVDNRSGAGGNLGTDIAAKSPADGYTLLVSSVAPNAINASLYEKVPYAPGDFTHISQLISGPNVLVAHPSLPARTFKEFVAYAKARPGQLSYASSGAGSSGNLAMELLKQQAGLAIVHIPYRGGSLALNDVLANQVPVMFINQDVVLPHVKAGKLKALAVTTAQRNGLYPEVPTIAESGFPSFVATSWVGLSAPRGLPAAIVDRLHTEVARAFTSPQVKSRLEASGFVVVASDPRQYTGFVAAESARWAQVIKTAGIKAD